MVNIIHLLNGILSRKERNITDMMKKYKLNYLLKITQTCTPNFFWVPFRGTHGKMNFLWTVSHRTTHSKDQ